MPTFKERAISDMRIPGYGGSYSSSYAPADDVMWGAGNQWNSKAWLAMGRYIYTPPGQVVEAYTSTNPDVAELSYLSSSPVRYEVYTRWLPWGHQFVGSSTQTPNSVTGWNHNTRQLFYDVQLWQRSKNTGLWSLLRAGQPLNDVLSSVSYQEQSFNQSDSRSDTTTGGKSYRPTRDTSAPTRPYRVAHWFINDFTPIGSTADIADVLLCCRTSLILHDPNGTDDRGTSNLISSIGCDPYPASSGVGLAAPPVGISKPRRVSAKWPNWEWLILHTMTEAQINSIGLPPALTNLAEGSGTVDPPVDPPPANPSTTNWSALASPRAWSARATTLTAPTKVRRGRRARME